MANIEHRYEIPVPYEVGEALDDHVIRSAVQPPRPVIAVSFSLYL